MKNGQPESLAEALLLIEKQKKRISEQEEKIRAQQGEIKILNDKLAVKRAREFAAKTESLKKLAQMQPLLFDLEDLGITVEHQCPSPSDEEIEQAINDDDLFGRRNDKKKPGRKKEYIKSFPSEICYRPERRRKEQSELRIKDVKSS